jgi:hypothetical protein
MAKSKTYFEQVPVELVKNKIAEELIRKEDQAKETEVDDVSHSTPAQKTEPYSVRVVELGRLYAS